MTPDEQKAQAFAKKYPKQKIVWIEHNGEKLMASQWARRYDIDLACFLKRLRDGWPFEKAVAEKPAKRLATIIDEAKRANLFAEQRRFEAGFRDAPSISPLERILSEFTCLRSQVSKLQESVNRIECNMTRAQPEEMMTVKEVAAFFKVSVRQVKALFDRYPTVPIGRRERRMRRSTLERILKKEI